MRVQIDESRRGESAAGVQHAQAPLGRNLALERRDAPETDADVAPAAQILARVEDVGVLDEEIELLLRKRAANR